MQYICQPKIWKGILKQKAGQARQQMHHLIQSEATALVSRKKESNNKQANNNTFSSSAIGFFKWKSINTFMNYNSWDSVFLFREHSRLIESKNKDKRLHAAPEPHTFLLFNEPGKLKESERPFPWLVWALSAYLTPAGPLLSLCSNFMCCSLSWTVVNVMPHSLHLSSLLPAVADDMKHYEVAFIE